MRLLIVVANVGCGLLAPIMLGRRWFLLLRPREGIGLPGGKVRRIRSHSHVGRIMRIALLSGVFRVATPPTLRPVWRNRSIRHRFFPSLNSSWSHERKLRIPRRVWTLLQDRWQP